MYVREAAEKIGIDFQPEVSLLADEKANSIKRSRTVKRKQN